MKCGWIRYAAAALVMVLGGGCTRANPSFGVDTDGEPGGSSSVGESGPSTSRTTGTSASGTSGTTTSTTTDSATTAPTSASTTSVPSSCGDGVLDPDEECDYAAQDARDCHTNCRINVCGDTKVAGSEACDDGNDDPFDECTNTCSHPACGDGIISYSEDCEPDDPSTPPTCNELGFAQGQVVCDDCIWTDVGCYTCGDGILNEEFEICEPSLFPAVGCDLLPNTVGTADVACNDACFLDIGGGGNGCCVIEAVPCVPGLPCCAGECMNGMCPAG